MYRFYLCTFWGRIGTTICDKKITPYSKTEAIQVYDAKLEEKQRCGYSIMDTYAIDDDELSTMQIDIPETKLPLAVELLMEDFFNSNAINRVIMQYRLGNDKLPLGRLSEEQIEAGFRVLIKIGSAIRHNSSDKAIKALSDEFYTTIPHCFGLKPPKPINDQQQYLAEWEMLNNIKNMDITCSIVKSSEMTDENIIDFYYNNLQADIREVDTESEIYNRLSKWVENTHGESHGYQLAVQNIYHIERHEDRVRFAPFEEDANANRQLLFHGSHITNFVGILRNGLQIRPEGIQTTGSMLGNGI